MRLEFKTRIFFSEAENSEKYPRILEIIFNIFAVIMADVATTNAAAELPTLLHKSYQKLLHPRKLSNSTELWFIIAIITPIGVFLI